MRKALIESLCEIAESDDRVVLMTADLGYAFVEPFADRYPDRFFNVGIAEQNLVGLATGIAESGFIPFIYSITPFSVLRPLEFIRNGPVKHNLKVRILGVGVGFDYAHNGTSHFGLEDIAVLRQYPNLNIFTPFDSAHLKATIQNGWDCAGPSYYRISKRQFPSSARDGDSNISVDMRVDGTGGDCLLVSCGTARHIVEDVRSLLAQEGVESTALSLGRLNPLPEAELLEALARHKTVFTVEEHFTTGGLGSIVADLIAANGLGCRLIKAGITPGLCDLVGSYDYFAKMNKLRPSDIVDAVMASRGEN